MIKKNKLLVMILVFSMLIPIISYAISTQPEANNNLFFSSDKNEATRGEKVTLSLNLDLIEYENFEFELTSDVSLDNINTQQKGINISNDNNNLKIIVNKSKINIVKIDLYYQIPEEVEIGTEIKLVGILREYENENTENQEETNNEEKEEQKITIIIKVVEKEDNNKNDTNNKDKENQMKSNLEKEENIMSKTVNNQQNINSTTKMLNDLSENTHTNTYNGESNNYLSVLEIESYNINPEFKKTNTTYFMEVENEINQITINAQAEDPNAIVNIYGNDNLKEGKNKILISVTAENGEVKNYRIYITKK